ncbi:MAG: bifunctional folylpolyglutamate synthase/dihydrofolate synthase [Cardiobacteriaceae bacterium]|nr:bifunctional folylpolyglutamate synthase/dihydrofolate synthase [Cardiobacteriaceae bacterium]
MIDFKTCRSLEDWLIAQETNHHKAWDLGLSRISEVWKRLGAPKIADFVISVAGTNGKGSCVCWSEAICRAAGISIASFSSPHLLDYRERIRFNGEKVSADVLIKAFEKIDAARGEISLSFFEWSALAAFLLMAEKKPQIAVLEVGLGGRLDAVNMLDADAAIFSRIGLDHQDWLGDTIEKIALEKAGIMRSKQRIAIAYQNPPANFLNAAKEKSQRIWIYGQDINAEFADADKTQIKTDVLGEEIKLSAPKYLLGKHQLGHFAACAAVINEQFSLNKEILEQASLHAKNFGRLTTIAENPEILIDVAHNEDSAEVLAEFLAEKRTKIRGKIIAVCAMLKDKDQKAVFRKLQNQIDLWFFASLDGTRGDEAENLAENAKSAGINQEKINISSDVETAVKTAKKHLREEDLLVITGSFVTVGKFLDRK